MGDGEIDLRSKLRQAMVAAELPGDEAKVIGRVYTFSCEHGSHEHVLSGTVTAIAWSDEAGLRLYVSSRQFWGGELEYFYFDKGRWIAKVSFAHTPLLSEDKNWEREQFSVDLSLR